ncbi:MAG: radical SAM protein [Acidobacteria bacterium]|nr:MAG: radical SAM protein [Acidobacteriota bacterium]
MPHSRCNCRCVMCDIWRANKNLQQLTAADLEPHLEALRRWQVSWVVLSGGEALMHDNLWTLCRQLRRLGARLTILSTGLLLARHAGDVVRHADEVIVSLDGPPPVHDEIRRVPRAYERLAAGVAALRAARRDFRVAARCVVQRRNFEHLAAVVDSSHQLGLDQISFLAADVSSAAFNRPDGWPDERVADVALSAAQARRLEEGIERLIDRYRADLERGFIAEPAAKLRAIGRYFRALAGDGELPPVRCNAPWTSAVVEADGSVRPCFFHPSFGNLRDAPIDAILNHPDAVAWRRQLDVSRDPTCKTCVCTLHLTPWQKV